MASIIRIKRSGTTGNPTTLAQGEFAYSYFNGAGGDRLYVGTGTETAGDAANHEVIGGKYYVDLLGGTGNAPFGVLTANTALIADSNSKLDHLIVDNIDFNGNNISTTTGNLVFAPTSHIDVNGNRLINLIAPVDDSDAANKAYVDAQISNVSFSIADDQADSDSFSSVSGVLTFAGGTGLTSNVTNDTITYSVDATGVTTGTYGSQTAIPVFTVNAQGQLDSAGTVPVATNLTINGDAISLLDSDVTLAASGNLTLTQDSSTNSFTYGLVDASTSSKGAAQFDANDFGVASGVVTLDDNVIKTVTTDTGTVDPSAHGINLLGTSNRGISFSASTDTITATIENADSNQKGVAQFDNTDFVASNGNVSLADVVLKGVTTDDGAVTPSGHSVSLLGGEGIDVNHTGAVITVKGEDASTSNKGVASFNSADFDVTSGDVTIKANAVGNGQLTNSTVKFGSTTVSLGDSSSTIAGLTQVEVGNLRLTGNTISNTDTNGILYIDPNPVGDSGDLYILGNLTVQGTTTTINSTELSINDLNIVLADSATNAAEADGAGLTVNGASATFSYSATGDKWTINKPLDVTGAITSSANVEAGSLTINGVAFEQLVDSEVANLLTAGEGIDLTYTDNTNELLIAAELATKSNPGVASFDSDQFTVTSGAVTIYQMDGGTY
jgi:hypothetical protein